VDLLKQIKEQARLSQNRIVLPEGTEERTIHAANKIISENIAKIILIGNKNEILKKADELNCEAIEGANIIDPGDFDKKEEYVDLLVDIRKKKGLTKEQAAELLKDPLHIGPVMIKNNDADGEVAGAINSTGNVLRPAFQIVKTMPGISIVSGAFIMLTDKPEYGQDGILVFADCAVNPCPSKEQLAEIAISTAETAKNIARIEPRVAMLSFSTKGSAKDEMVDKVIQATQLAREKAPELLIDGELQADAALVEKVGNQKAPDSQIAGKATVLIFPSLESGNIAYKLVQRLAGAEAIGPILQGMAAPINDLSRGCSVSDIVNMVAITANQVKS